MNRRFFLSLILGISLCTAAAAKDSARKSAYPEARKGDQVDDYHGTKVADPYRWLEDPDSSESRRWIEGENKITFRFLDAIPQRAAIKARLKQLWDYERSGKPTTKIIDEIGDRWAFLSKVLEMNSAPVTGPKPGDSSPND